MLKLKLQYFGHLTWRANSGKDPHAGKDRRQEEKGLTEDKMVGGHHQLNGHEFEQALGNGEGQGSLACCSPWGHKELDVTERLNNNSNEKVLTERRHAWVGHLCVTALVLLCYVSDGGRSEHWQGGESMTTWTGWMKTGIEASQQLGLSKPKASRAGKQQLRGQQGCK